MEHPARPPRRRLQRLHSQGRPRARGCRVARRGHAGRHVDRRDGDDVEHTGEYVEIDRPRRLVFDFSVPKYSSAVSRVSIDLAPVAGGCLLTLTHDGIPPEFVDGSRKGWTDLLLRLEEALAR